MPYVLLSIRRIVACSVVTRWPEQFLECVERVGQTQWGR